MPLRYRTVCVVRKEPFAGAYRSRFAQVDQLSPKSRYGRACLKDLTEDEEIVAYCRGPHCVLAFDAIEKLRQYGFKAQRLEDGYPEWRASGLPIEQENHV